MMCHGNGLAIMFKPHLLKPSITQIATSHLGGHPVQTFVSSHIEMLHLKFNTSRRANTSGKCLITIAFIASQMKIAMHRQHLVAQRQQHLEQRHRIGTSAHSGNNRGPRSRKTMRYDEIFNLFDEMRFFHNANLVNSHLFFVNLRKIF